MTTNLQRFLRKYPIFTYEQFARATGGNTQNPIRALLTHHIKRGHIVRVRKGLFASIPYGADHATYPINPFLLGGYAAPDAPRYIDTTAKKDGKFVAQWNLIVPTGSLNKDWRE